MPASLSRRYQDEHISAERRDEARAAAKRTREQLAKGDIATAVDEVRKRFPVVVARLGN